MFGVATKCESLLKFVVLAKCARVSFLKEDQTNLFDLLVGAQKVLDRCGRDLRGFSLGITVGAGRDGWEGNGGHAVLAGE